MGLMVKIQALHRLARCQPPKAHRPDAAIRLARGITLKAWNGNPPPHHPRLDGAAAACARCFLPRLSGLGVCPIHLYWLIDLQTGQYRRHGQMPPHLVAERRKQGLSRKFHGLCTGLHTESVDKSVRVGTSAAGLSGDAPCRPCRHGHSASIPHAFAPAALRTRVCGLRGA